MSALAGTVHARGVESDQTHSFTLRLAGELSDDVVEQVHERIGDVTLGVSSGAPYAAFDREAPTLSQAVASAIRDVESVGLRVLRVEPDDLVNMPEIARRTKRTRESVRLLIEAKRGPGHFPPPAARVGKHPVWRWGDVALWWGEAFKDPAVDVAEAAFITALNGALDIRRAAARLSLGRGLGVVVNVLQEGAAGSGAGDGERTAGEVKIDVIIGSQVPAPK